MKTFDTCGLSCPEPLVIAQKAAKSGDAEFAVIVDSISRQQSVEHILHEHGYKTTAKTGEDSVTITAVKDA